VPNRFMVSIAGTARVLAVAGRVREVRDRSQSVRLSDVPKWPEVACFRPQPEILYAGVAPLESKGKEASTTSAWSSYTEWGVACGLAKLVHALSQPKGKGQKVLSRSPSIRFVDRNGCSTRGRCPNL